MSGNRIGDAGAAHLGSMLRTNNTLTSLDIRGNDIGVHGIDALFAAIGCQNRTLTQLDLSAINGVRNHVGVKAAVGIADALKENSVLNRICLRDTGLGIEGVKKLSEGGGIRSCVSLDLSRNNIQTDGCSELMRVLRGSTSIETLFISHNGIGDGGAAAVAHFFRTVNSLILLDLSYNNIGNTGIKHLSNAFNHHLTKGGRFPLRVLSLAGNPISSDSLRILLSPLSGSPYSSPQLTPTEPPKPIEVPIGTPERPKRQSPEGVQPLTLPSSPRHSSAQSQSLSTSPRASPQLSPLLLPSDSRSHVRPASPRQSTAKQDSNVVHTTSCQSSPTLLPSQWGRLSTRPRHSAIDQNPSSASSGTNSPFLPPIITKACIHFGDSPTNLTSTSAPHSANYSQRVVQFKQLPKTTLRRPRNRLGNSTSVSQPVSRLSYNVDRLWQNTHLSFSTPPTANPSPQRSRATSPPLSFHLPPISNLNNGLVCTQKCRIEVLDLSCCELDSFSGSVLASFIELAPALKKLVLKENRLEDVGTAEIMSVLKTNTTLTYLDVRGNGIGDIGAEHIANAIALNKVMRHLDLSDNKISSLSGDAIAAAISQNSALYNLVLEFNDISFRAHTEIKSKLKANKENAERNAVILVEKEIAGLRQEKAKLDSLQKALDLERARYSELEKRCYEADQRLESFTAAFEAKKRDLEMRTSEKNRLLQDALQQQNDLSERASKYAVEQQELYQRLTQQIQQERDENSSLMQQIEEARNSLSTSQFTITATATTAPIANTTTLTATATSKTISRLTTPSLSLQQLLGCDLLS
ncbi:leucine Rich Repeat family protein [Pelomyxa schiedti]|nr:leucine Rich Repeat family protein [Pelomyxa schiedti]